MFATTFDLEPAHPIQRAANIRRNVELTKEKVEHGAFWVNGDSMTIAVWGRGEDQIRRLHER